MTARPRSGQKRAGKNSFPQTPFLFARPPVLGGGWVCVRRRRTHKSEVCVGILFKVGSNFIQKIPPVYNFSVFEGCCFAKKPKRKGKLPKNRKKCRLEFYFGQKWAFLFLDCFIFICYHILV